MQTDVNELIESLTELLEDGDRNVRMNIVRRLDEISGVKTVPPLIKLLGDPYENIRQRAVEALVRIGEPTIGPLIRVLGDVGVRQVAARALGEIGEPAIEPLIEALDGDDREEYVKTVACALGWIGGERVIEPLMKVLGDTNWEVQNDAAEAFIDIGEPAVEPLINVLENGDAYMFQGAAWALEMIGDERAVPSLIKALEDEDEGVRYAAASALGGTIDDRAINPLIKALEDEDEGVRQVAARALGGTIDERAIEHLIKALGDECDAVHWNATCALGGSGDELAIEHLIKALGVGEGGCVGRLPPYSARFLVNQQLSL